jgi:outer membrane immunogenic protein
MYIATICYQSIGDTSYFADDCCLSVTVKTRDVMYKNVAWVMALAMSRDVSPRCPAQETRGSHMKKKLAAHVAAAITLLAAGSAVAADMRMPTKAPPPAPPPPAYNWTGCYVGAGGGYGMFNQETQFVDVDGFPFGLSNDNGGRGWFGTVQVGCDIQVGSNIVIGAFGDYDFGNNIKGDMAVPVLGWVGEEKLKHSWAAGGRIGWIPWAQSQFLVYVSGGYTQAKFDSVDFVSAFDGGLTGTSLDRQKYSGWFIGTGYEYGFNWLPISGLFWKTEYRYADYDNERVPLLFTGTGTPTGESLDVHKRVHTVRSELVWRFNWTGGAPVAARY